MDDPSTDGRLVAALPIVERILGFIGRRNRLSADEKEDLASYVRLKLVERAASIFSRFGGRSSLDTYLAVIVQRLFLDYRAERKSKARIRASSDEPLLAGLPAGAVEDPVLTKEDRAAAGSVEVSLRRAIARLPEPDRLIVRLHFIEGLSVASVAKAMAVRQKPLYRRVERILAALKDELKSAGIAPRDAQNLIGRREFGIGWKNDLGTDLRIAADEPSKER